ncbi:hypothetical protein NEMBOFW57_009180 [Staphylotrichum longicolle]|uniref:Uncharacterized protein n=1 Tax=Staphylotrichum longicolle TaxID=669026 RepID=A0AAD4HWG7_9PEZI|nr:hypothetical protein NEMBOFW57_009180 [Staphylotrichum longicolle]
MHDPNASEWKVAQIAQLIAEGRSVTKCPISGLPEQHREVFERALRNVLSTETAQMTYAQIIDGFPMVSVARDKRGPSIDFDHPVFQENHDTLCPGAWEKMKEFHSSFDIGVLSMDERLLHAYSAESIGSRAFRPRLLEMVAVALHQLAVLLYKLGDMQQHEQWKLWTPPNRYPDPEMWPDPEPYPTLFFHAWFQEYKQYPEGVADMVGYWAEERILGGVVLFDRGASGTQCREIYFHSDRPDVTYRLYALVDEQKQKLFSFFADTSGLQQDVLPILGDSNNRVRLDPEDAVFQFHIYRDRWERPVLDERQRSRRRVENPLDFPEIEDHNWN